ncbi:MAG: hypothetical protein BJ554DRAFT_7765 [Olpidium bornovanus]|uniref:Uncharacterized protein n=1 Tax=Olpidium bornovanus TaxID=278681 RepID=A0A8H7ZV50_9FUNG|nr:MAG: hypothetical protein BJ554DRAFT_7765 [Olpidium bornovanus]
MLEPGFVAYRRLADPRLRLRLRLRLRRERPAFPRGNDVRRRRQEPREVGNLGAFAAAASLLDRHRLRILDALGDRRPRLEKVVPDPLVGHARPRGERGFPDRALKAPVGRLRSAQVFFYGEVLRGASAERGPNRLGCRSGVERELVLLSATPLLPPGGFRLTARVHVTANLLTFFSQSFPLHLPSAPSLPPPIFTTVLLPPSRLPHPYTLPPSAPYTGPTLRPPPRTFETPRGGAAVVFRPSRPTVRVTALVKERAVAVALKIVEGELVERGNLREEDRLLLLVLPRGGGQVRLDPMQMVEHRDGQVPLRAVLTDHVLVEVLGDLGKENGVVDRREVGYVR